MIDVSNLLTVTDININFQPGVKENTMISPTKNIFLKI